MPWIGLRIQNEQSQACDILKHEAIILEEFESNILEVFKWILTCFIKVSMRFNLNKLQVWLMIYMQKGVYKYEKILLFT